MKKLLSILLTLVMLLSMVACASSSANENKQESAAPATESYKIAVAAALSGGSAEEGSYIKNGVQLVVDEINEAGGINGKKVELVSYDDQNDPKNAATVANAIAADDSILAVVGHTNSSCSLAAAAVYEDAGIPQIICSASSPKISDAGEYIFRVWNSDTYTASVHVHTMLNKGYKTIGVIYENNDYGLGALNVTESVLAENDMKVAVAEGYLLGETKDFTTILTKMKDAGVDAILSVSGEVELPLMIQQAHAIDYYPFFTSTSTYQSTVIELGGADVDGLYGATFFDPNKLPDRVAEYYESFKKHYNTDHVAATACTSYIAGTMLMDALKSGAVTRDAIRDYLNSGLSFDTMIGELKFDENGDTEIPLQRIVIKDGAFVGAD